MRLVTGVRAFAVAAAVAACAAFLGACGTSTPTTVATDHVLAANFAFSPRVLTVPVGTTVTWDFDQPDAPHNVVTTSAPVSINSGTPKGRGTFAFTFTTPGTYHYYCQVHPYMTATIVVTP